MDVPVRDDATGVVISLSKARHARAVATGVAEIRLAAEGLAESASRMARCVAAMKRTLDIVATTNAVLQGEAARARRISGDSHRVEQAIESGDLAAMLALQRELGPRS
jgi:hypothetical protein